MGAMAVRQVRPRRRRYHQGWLRQTALHLGAAAASGGSRAFGTLATMALGVLAGEPRQKVLQRIRATICP